jgi:hypothetical protein
LGFAAQIDCFIIQMFLLRLRGAANAADFRPLMKYKRFHAAPQTGNGLSSQKKIRLVSLIKKI